MLCSLVVQCACDPKINILHLRLRRSYRLSGPHLPLPLFRLPDHPHPHRMFPFPCLTSRLKDEFDTRKPLGSPARQAGLDMMLIGFVRKGGDEGVVR